MNQAHINRKYQQVKKEILETRPHFCRECGTPMFLTPSHTIAQKDCKNYGHPELIWDPANIEILCVSCHERWERRDPSLKIFPRLMKYIAYITPDLGMGEVYQRYSLTSKR
jgi:5-methylcytosine-specific restriction endonuclease McrA